MSDQAKEREQRRGPARFAEDVRMMFDQLDIKYRSYSGRGMNGASCVGIVGYIKDYTAALIEIAGEDMKIDDMGLQKIFYWPDVGME